MWNATRYLGHPLPIVGLAAAFVTVVFLMESAPVAQQKPLEQRLHLNPVIAKLAEGKTVNGVDSPEYALFAVKTMRYPQLRGSKYMEPRGIRGAGPANATWIWGIAGEEYDRHADLWPLNPDGDLLATMMIESVEGLQNVDKIAAVP